MTVRWFDISVAHTFVMKCVAVCVLMLMFACGQGGNYKDEKILKPIRDSFATDVNRDIIFEMNGSILEEDRLVMTYVSPLVFSIQRRDSTMTEFKGGIKGNFYSKDKTSNKDQKTGYMEADYAIYYTQFKKMYLKGNVKIINQKGETLRSDDLWWDQPLKKVYTDGRVSFVEGGSKLYGIGFISNEDMSEYEVKKLTGTIAGL